MAEERRVALGIFDHDEATCGSDFSRDGHYR
ncbi:hypothetical protein XTALMG727_2314 [Xanthomonas translucens pv. arrhenatheri LMG 727]|uniref:Uncharacterized protein n=2 Tax=Xanthomonas graminis TaxID=3390026 RepID=A0A0K2ZRL9_9XANT|nr:hypothetical protein XTALMG727_2314 [Xanthomonas translucens pv. arrhenatheri LMG 727]CTP92237.1 hypothetical protein XTPLMG730_3423 [Xanthomonas translucens pv. phlei]